MKKVSQILILFVLVAFAKESFSQEFGVKAGLNFSNMLAKDNDVTLSDDYKSKLGFQFGPVVEFPFSDLLSLETGLMFTTRGFKTEDSGSSFGVDWESKRSVNVNYLDIPINLRAGFDVGSMRIYGNFGPYIGIALSGKYKSEYTVAGDTEEDDEKLDIGSDKGEDDLKRTDFGLNIGAAVAITSFEVGLNYGLGLANLSSSTDNGAKMKNRVFSITVAYKLGK